MHKQSESVQAYNALIEEGEQLGGCGNVFFIGLDFRLSTFQKATGNFKNIWGKGKSEKLCMIEIKVSWVHVIGLILDMEIAWTT